MSEEMKNYAAGLFASTIMLSGFVFCIVATLVMTLRLTDWAAYRIFKEMAKIAGELNKSLLPKLKISVGYIDYVFHREEFHAWKKRQEKRGASTRPVVKSEVRWESTERHFTPKGRAFKQRGGTQ